MIARWKSILLEGRVTRSPDLHSMSGERSIVKDDIYGGILVRQQRQCSGDLAIELTLRVCSIYGFCVGSEGA